MNIIENKQNIEHRSHNRIPFLCMEMTLNLYLCIIEVEWEQGISLPRFRVFNQCPKFIGQVPLHWWPSPRLKFYHEQCLKNWLLKSSGSRSYRLLKRRRSCSSLSPKTFHRSNAEARFMVNYDLRGFSFEKTLKDLSLMTPENFSDFSLPPLSTFQASYQYCSHPPQHERHLWMAPS